jgi:uncharacterized protein (TIGR00730 family)
MNVLSSVCVFCGSSSGARPEYASAARALGRRLAEGGITLVYGGGNVGLMGITADAALDAGGRVVGVIPQAMVAKEVAHTGISELRVVASMHERKAAMVELSDAFIALPGGYGTFEELFEVVTWAQLGIHAKPCGLLDVGGYFHRLTEFLDGAVAERFLKPEHRELLMVATSADELLQGFAAYEAPKLDKWIDPSMT